MKKSKLKIFAVLLFAASVASIAVACKKTCEHQINKWKVVTEATCTNEGVERGACTLCGEIVERSTAINPDNHLYGEWEITTKPTYDRDGKGEAAKTCSENNEHKITVSLPRLTQNGAGYEFFETTKEATVLQDGEITAVYRDKDGNGDISFSITVDKEDFTETVSRDDYKTSEEYDEALKHLIDSAVLLGSNGKYLIREGGAFVDAGTEGYDSSLKPGVNADNLNVSYVYGEDYVYTKNAGDRVEYWFSKTSKGKIFAVYGITDASGKKTVSQYPRAASENLNGYAYNSSWSGLGFYGAEGLLRESYVLATRNDNQDFKVSLEQTEDGRPLYKFSFGYYNVPMCLCVISVEFTLTSEYAMDYVSFYSKVYAPDQFYVPTKEQPYCVLKTNAGTPRTAELIEYHQITKSQKPEEPEHEYTEEAFKISDFDVTTVNGQYTLTGENGYVPQANAASLSSAKSYNVIVCNPQPATATLSNDPVTLYYVTAAGRRVPLTFTPTESALVWYSSDSIKKDSSGKEYCQLKIYSRMAGDCNFVLITDNGCEKSFKIHFNEISPTSLTSSIYAYSDDGYSWKTSNSITVYVGQPLVMKAEVPSAQTTFAYKGFRPILVGISEGATRDGITWDGKGDSSREYTSSIEFVASQAGVYEISLKSTFKGSNGNESGINARVKVTVINPPSIDEILDGEYVGQLRKGTATVSFGEKGTDGKTTVAVTTKKGTEVLSVYVGEFGELVCEHVEGVELGVKLEINEAYKLVFVNPTGFGSAKERVVLQRPEINEE